MDEWPDWMKWVLAIAFIATLATGIFIGYYYREVGAIVILGLVLR